MEEGPGRTVGVVSDGSALPGRMDFGRPELRLQAVEPLLRLHAMIIHELTDLPTQVLAVEPGRLRTAVDELLGETGAVFLPYVKPAAIPVTPGLVTDWDTTAIALTAALLTTLSRAGRPPRNSRVLIAGAARMPLLSQLVVATGVSEVTTWNPADADAFPLHEVAADADAVIDLVGVAAEDDPKVIMAGLPLYPLLALPGLVQAVAGAPAATMAVDVHLACSYELVMATAPDLRVPSALDRALVGRIADAATRAMIDMSSTVDDVGDVG
ncbi:hypothetical protein [Actinocrispum sp. NPDC049592]|uniref:hypothetical protein n=1 Tax=Actinocrispum sp. NPDC049592 TaxID=3154835 RepID=UPI0034389B0F